MIAAGIALSSTTATSPALRGVLAGLAAGGGRPADRARWRRWPRRCVRSVWARRHLVALATFVAIGLMRWPLLLVLIVLVPAQHRARLAAAAMKRRSRRRLVTLPVQFARDVAARARRRQRRGAGDASPGGRTARLDDRPPVHRHVRDLAGRAGPERDVGDADRLSRRGRRRRAGHDARRCAVRPAVLAYFLRRTWDRFRDAPWRIAVQAGLVPISVGLVGASAIDC